MILYHGSYKEIQKTNVMFSRETTDFGKGFYLTPIIEQAQSWAKHFIFEKSQAIVSKYDFFQNAASQKFPKDIRILEFKKHNLEWLEYVTACRLGKNISKVFDLIIGGVADDKVFDTLQLYFDKLISGNEAIGRLKYNKPSWQYCFKNQEIIDKYLKYIDCEEIL